MNTTEVTFLSRERTPAQRLTNVQGTILGVSKLIERARDGVEVNENVRCAAYWLRLAAGELDELLKHD
jgi:hypothetical protein